MCNAMETTYIGDGHRRSASSVPTVDPCRCPDPCVVWSKLWAAFAPGVGPLLANPRAYHYAMLPTDTAMRHPPNEGKVDGASAAVLPYNYSDEHEVFWLRAGTHPSRSDLASFALRLFRRREQVNRSFTLLTSDGDVEVHGSSDGIVRTSVMGVAGDLRGWAGLLGSPLLRGWYAQNALGTHPNLHPLPIGLDLHSPSRFKTNRLFGAFGVSGPVPFEERAWPSTPAARWALVQRLAASAPPREERPIGLFSETFDPIQHYRQRTAAASPALLPRLRMVETCRAAAYVLNQSVSKVQMLELFGRSQFVLSPAGRGADAHRTWEALAMGAIPVVLRQSPTFDAVYRAQPVLLVDSWEQACNGSAAARLRAQTLRRLSGVRARLDPRAWLPWCAPD